MSAPEMLFLTVNDIDKRWIVLDAEDFCFGDGETPEDAIASARLVSEAPIETYWGEVPANKTELPHMELVE